jgi:hypothetical protein
MENQEFDPIEAEKIELDILTNKGMSFEIGRRWTKWLSDKQTRTFTIRPLPVGVMDRLTYEYIRLDLDEELLKEENLLALQEAKLLVHKHAYRCARIVAIAVLNSNPFYWLLVGILSQYFYMRLTSKMLFQVTMIINRMSNYGGFTASIRYLRSARTTRPMTEPTLVEQTTDIED